MQTETIHAIVISPDGAVEMQTTPTDYQAMTTAVGGYVQHFNLGDDACCFVNEEGKAMGLPRNEMATVLLQQAGGMPGDYVVGSLMICGCLDAKGRRDGENHPVPARWQQAVRELTLDA